VLLDKHITILFSLLYQVATGGLEAGSIAYPIRKVIQEYDEFYFRLTNVQEIDTKTKKLSPRLRIKLRLPRYCYRF
jgi:NADH dehydrogenase